MRSAQSLCRKYTFAESARLRPVLCPAPVVRLRLFANKKDEASNGQMPLPANPEAEAQASSGAPALAQDTTQNDKNTSENTNTQTEGAGKGGDEPQPPPPPLEEKVQVLTKADLIKVVQELRRMPRRQVLALRITLLVSLIASCGVYLFWDEIKPYIGQQTAEVATLTLEDETVQVKVGEFAKELLSQLIGHYSTDAETRRLTIDFVKAVISDPATAKAAAELATQALQDPALKVQLQKITKDTALWLLNDPYINLQILELLKRVVSWEETQQLLIWLAMKIATDPQITTQAQNIAASTIGSQTVQQQLNETILNTAFYVMNDEGINERAHYFLEDTFASERLQEIAGYAMWDAVKVALTPSLFRRRRYPSPKDIPAHKPAPVTAKTVIANELDKLTLEEKHELAEIIFRESYAAVRESFGVEFSAVKLMAKKRAFEAELAKRKAAVTPEIRRLVQSISNEYFGKLWEQEEKLIDAGGEEALVLRGKTKVDGRILSYLKYLEEMPKQEKGYLWSGYTEQQQADRHAVTGRIRELEEERNDTKLLLQRELEGIHLMDPISHFPQQTYVAFLEDHRQSQQTSEQ